MKRIAALISLIFISSPTLAKEEYYYYKDSDGNWVQAERVYITGQRPSEPAEPPPRPHISGFGSYSPWGVKDTAGNTNEDVEIPLAAPPAEDDSAITCSNTTSKPVIITTGEKIKDEVDFMSMGLYGFNLTRTYRSQQASGTLFGANWMSTLDFPSLRFGRKSTERWSSNAYQEITFIEPDGTKYLYQADSFVHPELFDKNDWFAIGGYYSVKSALRTGQLTWEKGVGYTLSTPSGTYEYSEAGVLQKAYNNASGQLIKVEHRVGGIIDVSNNAGQKVQLRLGANHRVAEVQDPSGNTWKYTYNQNGMLTKVTSPDADPDIREYHYEDSSAAQAATLLTGISINSVRYSRYSYYPDGRVRRSALEGDGEADNFVYGQNETTVTDAKGASTTFSFAPIQAELKITRVSRVGTSTCSSAAAETVYDTNGYIDYVLDWKKNKTDYEYDAYGRLKSTVEAAGTSEALKTIYTWSGTKNTGVEHRGVDGNPYLQLTNTYLNDRLTKQVATDAKNGEQRIFNYAYVMRPAGTIASVTASIQLDEGEAISVENYDEFGRITSRTNALGQTESWSDFNGLGLPRKYLDINGQTTEYDYDKRGLVKSIVSPGPRTTNFVYEHDRQIKSIRSSDGRMVQYKYDAARRQVGIGNALGEFTETNLNLTENSITTRSARKVPALSNGVLSGKVDGEFSAKTIFDSEGRPYDILGNNGQKVQKRYDDNGNLLTVTNAAGRVTTYEYNFRNQLSRMTAADGGVVELAYDNEGRNKTVTDPRSLQTHYGYNGFGDVISLVSPDTRQISYTYDRGGRLRTKTTAARATEFTWDMLSRQTRSCSSTSCKAFTYDEGAYGMGHLTKINDGTGQTNYTYNAAGQLLGQRNDIYGQVFNTSWTYDNAGRMTGMTYPTGLVITYEYDNVGRRTAIKSPSALKAKN
ncbi:DUF6531 domain-containing protein [Massilia sp. CMS3.1]|uniref:RHS repeat domain-containing protein n=1 Tax=Massilia sp. CMS3.1 TaxID=3373083 RepID=UPI003EE6E176